MARRANPAMIGAFVLGAVVLGVAALVVFGGGKFMKKTQPLVAYFDGSLKGMAIGAPVTFNGVKIGSVTDFKVIIDTKSVAAARRVDDYIDDHYIERTSTITTPVYFEIDADRLYSTTGKKITFRKNAAGVRTLYEKGFRAQLEVQSLVTGQLEVALNFYPGAPLRLTGLSKDVPEVPTIPSSIERLSRTLDKLPLDEIVADVHQTLDAINKLANAPEVKTTLRDLSRAVANADKLAANADKLVLAVTAEVPALMGNVTKTTESAQATLKELQAVVTRVGGVAETALAQYQQLAENADAQLAPLMANVSKVAVSADKTLLQAERALTSVESAINEDSPLRYDVVKALREVQSAARSLRILMDYLDQHPEAVISGKRAEGMR
jgi:phospholipid/cholesterol/gamma-HCH transport system substrate-binding protein